MRGEQYEPDIQHNALGRLGTKLMLGGAVAAATCVLGMTVGPLANEANEISRTPDAAGGFDENSGFQIDVGDENRIMLIGAGVSAGAVVVGGALRRLGRES